MLDLDLKSFFDSLDHSLVLRSVAHHTDCGGSSSTWSGGSRRRCNMRTAASRPGIAATRRARRSPPVLANIFLHYALDLWQVREFPGIPFERYADDGILHCDGKAQGQEVLDAIVERLAQVGLELNLDKTRIVYCKDSNRGGSALTSTSALRFWGYTFRPRRVRKRRGEFFVSFAQRSPTTPPRRSATRSSAAAAPVQREDPRRPCA